MIGAEKWENNPKVGEALLWGWGALVLWGLQRCGDGVAFRGVFLGCVSQLRFEAASLTGCVTNGSVTSLAEE